MSVPNEIDILQDNLSHLHEILSILDAKNDNATLPTFISSPNTKHSHFAYHIMTGGYINCFRSFKKTLFHHYCWIQPMTWLLFISAYEPGLVKKAIVYTYQMDPYKTYHALLTCPISEGIPIFLKNKEYLVVKPLCAPEHHVW